MCAGADDARWQELIPSVFNRPSVDRSLVQARKDASAMGFSPIKPVKELTEPHNYEELAHASYTSRRCRHASAVM